VFRGQDLPPAMHVDFSARFGPLIGHVVSRFNLQDHPQVTILSNISNERGEKIDFGGDGFSDDEEPEFD
jgi:taurine dioxygenase